MVMRVAIDIETSGGENIDPYSDKILLTSVVFDDKREELIEGNDYPNWLLELIGDNSIMKLCHSASFEGQFFLAHFDQPMHNVWDTLACERLLTAGKEIGNDLQAVAQRRLGIWLNKNIRTNFGIGVVGDPEREYCMQDSRVLLQIQEQQKHELKADGQMVAAQIENDVSQVIADMEYHGIGFDKELWDKLVPMMCKERDKYQEKIWLALKCPYQRDLLTGGVSGGVSLGSRDQILPALARVGVDLPNYQKETLLDYSLRHPECEVVRNITEFKRFDKAVGWDYPQYVNSHTGRIHTDWRQTGADTMRMSAADPNLQQVTKPFGPINFRHLFRARPGYKFIGADYSQIELRILIDITKEPEYLEAIKRGDYLHAIAASGVLDREVKKGDKECALGKGINFGVLAYRGGHWALIGSALPYGMLLSQRDARKYVKRVREKYTKIEEWGKNKKAQMQRDGFIQTSIGHRRHLWGEQRESVARNTDIQMLAAGILKDALRNVFRRIQIELSDAHIVLQVHDELVLEVREEEVGSGAAILVGEMTDAGERWVDEVPIDVDYYVSDTWEK